MPERGWRDVDLLLIALVLATSIFGLVAIASSTAVPAAGMALVRRQAVGIGGGLVVMAVFALIDYHAWARWANLLYVLNLGLLAIVFLAGHQALGAQRWLQLGPIQVQPSELAKLLVILTLAAHLAPRVGEVRGWIDAVPPAVHVALPALLVMLQPDLGTSLVFVAILVGMLYVAGMPGWRLAAGCGAALGAVSFAIFAHLHWRTPILLKDYQLKRLIAFTNPQADPLGWGYHVLQSEIAIGSGRVSGLGLFGGQAPNGLSFLPESQTDFIYAVVGRSMGFVGAAALLVAFFLIIWRGVRIVAHARDAYGALLAAGVVAMLAFHVVINTGMTMGMMPVTGVPLPFTSYGISALLSDYAGIGLLLSVYLRHRKIQF